MYYINCKDGIVSTQTVQMEYINYSDGVDKLYRWSTLTVHESMEDEKKLYYIV